MAETIVLGGGCFWCVEAVFAGLEGVIGATPGYSAGRTKDPTYEEVCTDTTGHAEVVRVEFEPAAISLETILEVFFALHDPTQLNRQGEDVGTQYRSIILCSGEEQRKAAEAFVKRIAPDFDAPIVTKIRELEHFYPAEEHHRDYFARNPEKQYCSLVVGPKVRKMREKFKALMK